MVELLKVPAGIFREVNEIEYLKNTEFAYQVCRKYIKPFIVETLFDIRQTENGTLNTMYQRKIVGNQLIQIKTDKLSRELKTALLSLGEGLLRMLQDHKWIPDINLHKSSSFPKDNWEIRNIIQEKDNLSLYDFTTYYDVFRLYPERTEQEVMIKGNAWQSLIRDISNV